MTQRCSNTSTKTSAPKSDTYGAEGAVYPGEIATLILTNPVEEKEDVYDVEIAEEHIARFAVSATSARTAAMKVLVESPDVEEVCVDLMGALELVPIRVTNRRTTEVASISWDELEEAGTPETEHGPN